MAQSIVIFANVGTSILGNFRHSLAKDTQESFNARLDILEKSGLKPQVIGGSGHDLPGEDIISECTQWAMAHGEEASAEIKSTQKIVSGDSSAPTVAAIHLLATDTIQGMLAAHVVARVLHESLNCHRVEVHRIGGLQVQNGSEFARFGLPDYIGTIYTLLDRYPASAYRRIFNPTGGFKALVPYLTLIAMLEGAETRYIFERSDDLLELRPLPISFDEELVEQALPVLEETVANNSLTRAQLEDQLNLNEPFYTSRFASLWNNVDGEHY